MKGGSIAVVLALVLLAAVVMNVFMTRSDRLERSRLETVIQPTAVGSAAYFEPPESLTPGSVLVYFQNLPLEPLDESAITARDSMMEQAGMDDSGRYPIFKSKQEKSAVGDLRGFFFLKTGDNRYLRAATGQ